MSLLPTTTHAHSWATIAYSLDVPEHIIAQALGHATAHTITSIYIKRDEKKVDKANRAVIDYLLLSSLLVPSCSSLDITQYLHTYDRLTDKLNDGRTTHKGVYTLSALRRC